MSQQKITEQLWKELQQIDGVGRACAGETPTTIAAWTRTNAHRIYPALRELGLEDDSFVREAFFAFAAHVLSIDYDWFYDAWLEGAAA